MTVEYNIPLPAFLGGDYVGNVGSICNDVVEETTNALLQIDALFKLHDSTCQGDTAEDGTCCERCLWLFESELYEILEDFPYEVDSGYAESPDWIAIACQAHLIITHSAAEQSTKEQVVVSIEVDQRPAGAFPNRSNTTVQPVSSVLGSWNAFVDHVAAAMTPRG